MPPRGQSVVLVSQVPRRHGLEAWRLLKEEYEGQGGNRTAALLRTILNPRARRERMHSEGRDLGDILFSWEKDVAQCGMPAGATLQQILQVATSVGKCSCSLP